MEKQGYLTTYVMGNGVLKVQQSVDLSGDERILPLGNSMDPGVEPFGELEGSLVDLMSLEHDQR
jgi:hypothetical protein